jgi:xylan 1,4-beta-xylosidase
MSVFFEKKSNTASALPFIRSDIKNINHLSDYSSYFKIVLVNSVTVESFCSHKSYIANEGDIIVILPREIHSFKSVESSVTFFFLPSFKGDEFDISELTPCERIVKKNTYLNSEIKKQAAAISAELSERMTGYSYSALGASSNLASLILKANTKPLDEGEDAKKADSELSLLENIQRYIEENYKENISLESVSSYCGLSLFYFSHLFKRITDITFYDYLTSYRLDLALDMLVNTDKKILDIASECGFATVRTFNRSFKSYFGCSPSEYLKNVK